MEVGRVSHGEDARGRVGKWEGLGFWGWGWAVRIELIGVGNDVVELAVDWNCGGDRASDTVEYYHFHLYWHCHWHCHFYCHFPLPLFPHPPHPPSVLKTPPNSTTP